ncbi:MAG: hypothetical protein DI565_19580 [Ancylobacter novellus]|uniref:Sulfotransferase n=1 Tax=Ancylobacter novellus TaxID=921 RepID=A0A2W5K1Z9_ANCNO|nr:MAG: hypothetical protein DI565_19580 [Ancylobacter novellus]
MVQSDQQDRAAYEELARLEASALFYFQRSEAQNARIEDLEKALRRFQDEGVRSEKLAELDEKLSRATSSLALSAKLVAKLKSALVAKEQVRFDLETKLRSVLSGGRVAVQLRSSRAPRAEATGEDEQPAPSVRTSVAAPSGSLYGASILSYRSMLTRHMAGTSALIREEAAPYAALKAPSKGFLFVLTYPRSGDLVLQKMLNSIPGYCIRGELGGAVRPLSRAWAETVSRGTRGDKDDLEVASLAFGWDVANEFVAHLLAPPESARVVGFRSNEIYDDIESFWNLTSFLYTTFPHARIIFNTRNAERVSRSGPWARQPQDKVLQTLRNMDGFFDDFARSYPERSLCVKYDDYTTSSPALKRLYDFLGEDVRPLLQ